MKRRTTERRVRVGGMTMGRFRLTDGYYYFVDEGPTSRRPASRLERLLWERLFGTIATGCPIQEAHERRMANPSPAKKGTDR